METSMTSHFFELLQFGFGTECGAKTTLVALLAGHGQFSDFYGDTTAAVLAAI